MRSIEPRNRHDRGTQGHLLSQRRGLLAALDVHLHRRHDGRLPRPAGGSRQVWNIEVAKGVTTFAIMSGAAGYDGAREQMRQLTDRTLQMREASYDVLLEWMANSTVARSNANAGERSRMEDPTAWLEVETETKSQNGSSPPPGWWEPSTPGQPAQSGRPAVPDQDALCYRSRPGTDRGIVIVCDGAGRAAGGRIGAPAAAVAALESCSELTGSPNQDRPNLLRCTVTTVRQTETKSQIGSSPPPGWWEPSTPGATSPIRTPCST